MLRLPVSVTVLLRKLNVICDEDVIKEIVVIHCPNLNSHTTNFADVAEWFCVLEVVWVVNLTRSPRTLQV